MLSSRKLWIRLCAAVITIGGLAAIPTTVMAEDACTVTVTLGSGQHLSFTVDVPPGTPLSSIQLPVIGSVVGVSENCISSTTTTTATDTTTTGADTTTTGTDTLTQSTIPATVSVARQSKSTQTTTSTTTTATTTTTTPLTTTDGTPADTNPSFSFAMPGAAAVGVPNFFIDDFQIPPFLLPIYQAAGIEYDVPWQVLAAINWIETDYGRDLNVSSAGAVGWMQFLPSTFKRYGVDATGSGYADPYNPTDAIFTAARYLAAAGAAKDLSKAIFAYNHASWYVQSVLLRAQLIGGMPSSLIGALTDLVEGHFPVAAAAKYADDSVDKLAGKKVTGLNAAIPVDSTTANGTAIFAKAGSPVVAVNDGKIIKIGISHKLGRYIVLQDETGNTYTYSNLGSIPALYPVPKAVTISKGQLAKELAIETPKATSKQSATAGSQPALSTAKSLTGKVTKAIARETTKTSHTQTSSSPLSLLLSKPVKVSSQITTASKPKAKKTTIASIGGQAKQRLFANPSNPDSFRAGGEQQLAAEAETISNFQNYFSDALHLAKNQYTLEPLRVGSTVVAGTILGRIGHGSRTDAAHLWFQLQPAGKNEPFIDPKPILDGWKLLEATAVYRADGLNPFFGSNAKTASIGEILLESKQQLQTRVLEDPHVSIYACGRRDVQAGEIDRRILGAIEYLSASGLDPTVSGLKCDAGSNGIDSAGKTGASMDITAINGIPIAGHQGPGSITDITIRRLLSLQGLMVPEEIISQTSYKGQANTLSLPDHANRIQVTYTPAYGSNKKLASQVQQLLKPKQWIQLIQHIGQIPEPTVPVKQSSYAIKTNATG